MTKKFARGPAFTTMTELADWLEGGEAVYLRDKYLSAGWAMSMQFKYLMQQVKQKVVFRAIENTGDVQ
jgi:hypothetical protein